MKIHRTKMGCLSAISQAQQRTAMADKTSDNSDQDENHSVEYVHADTSDSALLQSIEEKRKRLNLPAANETERWKKIDSEIHQKLSKLLDKSSLGLKLETYGDIIYQTCRDLVGTKQTKERRPPQKSRRQREMDELRGKKRALKKRMKKASELEKAGLKVLWEELKSRHSALSKAEALRRKRSKRKKTQDRFFRDPFQFARTLFEQPKSGTLSVEKETLERHLRDTYSDKNREVELDEVQGLIWPAAPGEQLNSKPPTMEEVERVVNKGRSKSAPGPNGIPYLLYKKCPNVLRWLHRMIRAAWKNERIPQQWMCAEGVYIPKEQNSTEINQFRPISLLNVEGKIFFSVMASRLTRYLVENGYVDTKVQKGGIPGVPGCLEHATMIWEAIQRAKTNKLNLDVIWLDLANAYGSVPHQMIQLALRMYHVPENIRRMLAEYFGGFQMRFSTSDFTTDWINLEVGIAMGCAISPILFVLAMEVILKAAGDKTDQVDLGDGCMMPALKAFMDDTTVLSTGEGTLAMLSKLDRLIDWCRMKFKPKKSRSLSLRKGKVAEDIRFSIAGQPIPTVSQEPVKSLGRWYDASLKDTKRGKETLEQTAEGLQAIEKSGLQGKHKLWCLQHMLIPKLLWPLLVYEITSSTVERIEAKINKFTRRWLHVPPCLTDVALYCRQAKLRLPLKSIVEEYKVGKVRLHTMLEGSADEVVKTVQPTLKTGRKWKVQEGVDQAEAELKMKEIMGHTQETRQGLGMNKMSWWSEANGKQKRDLVIQAIRQDEDKKRVVKAVQQSQQGHWTAWEQALQRSLTWNDIWNMPALRTSFILRSAYDLLPSNSNLVKWKKAEDPKCPLCQKTQTVEHVLSSCKTALGQGRYTWRHNRVLDVLASSIDIHGVEKSETLQKTLEFTTEGGSKRWKGRPMPVKTQRGLLSGYDDWQMAVDLPSWDGQYPEAIKQSRMRPDIVLHSRASRQIIMIELTVPYECRIEEAHTFKTEKYSDLANDLKSRGHQVKIMAVEVGARGFVGASMYKLFQQLNISSKKRARALKSLGETAEKSSHWIWIRRNDMSLNKE